MYYNEDGDFFVGRTELLKMYDTAGRYYYFMVGYPEDEYRYLELRADIMDLCNDFREVCVGSKDLFIKDFGRQGYWFSASVNTLLADPKKDDIYRMLKFRFIKLVEAREKAL